MNNYTYDEIEVGHKEAFTTTVTQEMMDAFLSITNDVNPLHNDEAFAISKGHPGKVVYGMLTSSFLSTLAGVYLPGENSLIHEITLKMVKPVYVDDVLTVEGVVKEKNDTFNFIIVKATIFNQKNEKVLKAQMRIGII